MAPRHPFTRPTIAIALAIAVAAVLLNVAVARLLVRIGTDAQALAENWISRAATLTSFERGLRDFRQREALFALAGTDTARADHGLALDSLRDANTRALRQFAAADSDSALARHVVSVDSLWSTYLAAHDVARALPGGAGSAAILAFRLREPVFEELTGAVRLTQDALRAGAGQVAVRSRRSTRTSSLLLGTSILLTFGGLLLAELVRRSTRARTDAEQRWQDVADQSLGIIWEVDAAGRLCYSSSAGFDLLDAPAARVIGRRVLAFVHPDDRRAVVVAAEQALRGTGPLEDLELRVCRADGSVRWLAVSGRPLQERGDRQRYGLRGLAVDITRRTQAEQALEQRRRLESLGTLAGGVAHDLNNVLASVTAYAELARDELPPAHRTRDDLAAIQIAADRGRDLVRHILQFARRQPVERQTIDFTAVVREVVQLLRPGIPHHIALELSLPPLPCTVLGNATELHQVVLNILTNALHAMRGTGSRLAVRIVSNDEHVSLVIEDDGEGMTADVERRALEPFFTTREVGEGTGMGLAVAHGIVRSLGGSITIRSAVGRGTTVRVDLPLATAAEAMPEAPIPPSRPVAVVTSLPARILLVDDDLMVLNAMRRVLERAGHHAEVYGDAASALEAMRADPARADVVFTDLSMPGASGLEFAAAVRALPSAVPLVLVSGYLDADSSTRATALGITRQLHKPVAPSTLLEAVDDVMAAHPPSHPLSAHPHASSTPATS